MKYELYHHGVKGMRWGIRRYRNKDGYLTPAGEKRLERYKAKELGRVSRKYQVDKLSDRVAKMEDNFDRKHDSYAYHRLTRARYKYLKAQTMEFIERQKVANMSYADMKNERAETRKLRAKHFISELDGMIFSAYTKTDLAKTNSRVGLDESIYAEYEARKNTGYKGF